MATTLEFNSLGWISNLAKFQAILAAGFCERQDLFDIITSEHADNVLKGLNQYFHWNRKLQEKAHNNIVTLTLMGRSGLLKPEVTSLLEAITQVLGSRKINGINYPENSNFISFLLEDEEAVRIVKKEMSVVNGALVCYIEDRPSNNFIVRVLWSPPYYTINELTESLKPWCEMVDIAFETDSFKNGEKILNNKASGSIQLKENIELSAVPHIFKLVNTVNKYSLLVIKERPPLCLKCKCVGHVRRSCDMFKCIKCHSFHSVKIQCPMKSYADMTKKWLGEQGVDFQSRQSNFTRVAVDKINMAPSESFKSDSSSNGVPLKLVVNEKPTAQKVNTEVRESFPEPSVNYRYKNDVKDEGWCQVKRPATRKKSIPCNQMDKDNRKIVSENNLTKQNTFFVLGKVQEWGDVSSEDMDDDNVVDHRIGMSSINNNSKMFVNAAANYENQKQEERNKRKLKNLRKKRKIIEEDNEKEIKGCDNKKHDLMQADCTRATEKTLLVSHPNDLLQSKVGIDIKELPGQEVEKSFILMPNKIDDNSTFETETPSQEIGLEENNSEHSGGVENSDEEVVSESEKYKVILGGFPVETTTDEVECFMGEITADYMWMICDEEENPNGEFEIEFSLEEKALEALNLDGQVYKDYKISACFKEYDSD